MGAINDYSLVVRLAPEYSEAYGNRGVAKINLLLSEEFPKDRKQRQLDACGDLRRAKKFDDPIIATMIEKYCKD